MAKFRIGATAIGFTLALAFAGHAAAIENAADCDNEGGTMVNVKQSDYCLVPIRPEAYRGEAYDGNKLGVTECPGNELNDGVWCMYPVTIREQTIDQTSEAPASEIVESAEDVADDVSETMSDMADDVEDAVTPE